jgi:hypothetical protein
MEANWVLYVNTTLRYYLHIDPDTLSETEWAQTFAMLQDIRQREAKP